MMNVDENSKSYKDGFEFAKTLKVGDNLEGGLIGYAKEQFGYINPTEQTNFISGSYAYFTEQDEYPCIDAYWNIVRFEKG